MLKYWSATITRNAEILTQEALLIKNARLRCISACYSLLMPRPDPVSLRGGGEVGIVAWLPLRDRSPSPASRSKKSDQSSARDSLLLELLAMSIGSVSELFNDGVDGTRLNGDKGILKLLFEAPGRARPACSFCSVKGISVWPV